MVKNLAAKAGNMRDTALILELGRSPGGEHDNPPQYSCLEKPMDRGTWRGPRGHKASDTTEWLGTHAQQLMHVKLCFQEAPSSNFFFPPLRRCKNRVIKDEFCDSSL